MSKKKMTYLEMINREKTPGELVSEARDKKNWSQEYLEWRSGVARSQIGRIERDEVPNPRLETILKLEEALEIPLQEAFRKHAAKREHRGPKKRRGTQKALGEFEKRLRDMDNISDEELKEAFDRTLKKLDERTAQKPGKGKKKEK